MTIQTIKEKAREEFDKISEKQIFTLNNKKGTLKNTIIYNSILNLLDSTIDSVIKEREEELIKEIIELTEPYENSKWLNNVNPQKIINLIKSKNDK